MFWLISVHGSKQKKKKDSLISFFSLAPQNMFVGFFHCNASGLTLNFMVSSKQSNVILGT